VAEPVDSLPHSKSDLSDFDHFKMVKSGIPDFDHFKMVKSDIPDFDHFKMVKSGIPDFTWGRVGGRAVMLRSASSHDPHTPTPSPQGGGEEFAAPTVLEQTRPMSPP
jgi:hypothetical protein